MRLAILTDIHHCQPGSATGGWHNPHQFDTVCERLEQSLAWLRDQGVDRVAVLGDLTHYGDVTSLGEVVEVLGRSGLPCWVLPGNHDLGDGPDTLAAVVTGAGYANVTQVGGCASPLANGWQAAGIGIGIAQDNGGYRACPLPESVVSGGDAPLLALSHFPLLSTREAVLGAGLKYAGDLVNAGDIAAGLRGRIAPALVINGHLHVRHAVSEGPVLQASCGAQVESLFEVTVVDFGDWDSCRISWQASAIQPEWPGVSPAMSDPAQSWAWNGSGWRQV